MGGASSHQNSTQDSASDASTSLPSTSKSSNKLVKATSKLKLSFKRKPTARDRTRPFRDLIKSWPPEDLNLLLREFYADSRLLELQKKCDVTRKNTKKFTQIFADERESYGDLTVVFKKTSFKIHRKFLAQRCKNLEIPPENVEILELRAENFQQFREQEVRNFLTKYIYIKVFPSPKMDPRENLARLKAEFGCTKGLGDDVAAILRNDLKHGDLVITVIEDTIHDKKSALPPGEAYEIRCCSSVASCRSPLIRSLLCRKTTENCGGKERRISFDEHIFPRAFAALFVNFLYTDTLDWSCAPSSEVSVSSLSQAKAITCGKAPDVQLYRALQIMQVARFFGVDAMVHACEDVVVRHLTCDNVVHVLEWSRDNGSKYIATHAFRLLESQFSRIALSASLFELSAAEMRALTHSQFVQCTELELLDACIRWGEHALLKKLEEREPNVVADTCHSISRRGLKRAELGGDELREILKPLTDNIRKDYALPPFHQSLTEAYSRGILERAPLEHNLVVCKNTSEINPDVHWLRPDANSSGPRYYLPYHETLMKMMSRIDPDAFPEMSIISDESKLEFVNWYPEILSEEQFLRAKTAILEAVEKEDVRRFARAFHRNFAVQIITRRILIEMDISEECLDCHVAYSHFPPDILPI
ncbi:unnamed protein product [Caenorhabditis sp. 36 PRJEB53466]|nr:unnamed protein product [Caenorhabditis sp. 36 PRJEB53466]